MSDVIILAEAVHDHEATMLGRYFNPLTVAKFSQKVVFLHFLAENRHNFVIKDTAERWRRPKGKPQGRLVRH